MTIKSDRAYAICTIRSYHDASPQVETVRFVIGRKREDDLPEWRYVADHDALNRLFCNGKDTAKAGYEIIYYGLFSHDGDTMPYIRMSYGYWMERYKPVMVDGRDCELKRLDYAEAGLIAKDPDRAKHLWTEVQADDAILISSGWRYVNRMDYHLTELPCEFDAVEVYDEPEPNMVDDVNCGYSTLIHKSHGIVRKTYDGEVDNFFKAIRKIAKRSDIELDVDTDDLDELVDEFKSESDGLGIEIELY